MSTSHLGPDFPAHRPLTMREFLRVDGAREDRHEFVAGEVFRRPDSTRRHAVIVGNLVGHLHFPVRDSGGWLLHVFRTRIRRDVVYYPDLLVDYTPMPDTATLARDAVLVVEVASPGTALVDGREKLLGYRRLPSLRTYLVVDEVRPRVDRYWRDTPGGPWQWEEVVGDGDVALSGLPTSVPNALSLAEIYEGVTFPPEVFPASAGAYERVPAARASFP